MGRTRLRRFSAAPTNSRRGGDTAPSYDSSVRRRTPRVHRNRRGTRTVVEGRASIVTSRRCRRAGLLGSTTSASQRQQGLDAAGGRRSGRRRRGLEGLCFSRRHRRAGLLGKRTAAPSARRHVPPGVLVVLERLLINRPVSRSSRGDTMETLRPRLRWEQQPDLI